MQETYYLGMEPRWVAHVFSLWYDSGLDVDFQIGRSKKTPGLVLIQITINPKEYDQVILVNKMWQQTGCQIHKV